MILDTHFTVWKCLEKFLESFEFQKHPPKTHSCLNFFQSNLPSNRLWGGMKSKKVPSAHVWGYIIALKYPKLTPFISACRYDHKEVFQYMFGVGNALEKFSHGPQDRRWWSLKHNFRAPNRQNTSKWRLKRKKWPLHHVCGNKIWLTHQKLTWVASAQSHDHEEACEYTC